MSAYLLDTNVISSLAPTKAPVPAPLLRWLDQQDADGRLFLSVVTIHEIEKGIALLTHKGASARALALRSWLTALTANYDDRILPLSPTAASLAGQLEAKALSAGSNPGMADALVAGIAAAHGLTVVTENIRHFIPFGIPAETPASLTASP
ncbi:MAG: type II toxin-antitoxin system VapC family toxin [Alphaproteobacteria bacterium]|nr:type II toxin-antitoxin system VapC family toxin [Alphaproteobacteria bacterium]